MNPSSGGPGNDGSVNASQALANSVQEDESSDDDILHTLLGKRQREQTCDFRSLATPPSGAHTTVMNTTFGPNDCSESLQTNTLSLATGIRTDAMIQNPQHKRRHQMSLNPAEHAGYLQNTFDGTGPAGMLTNTLAAQPTGNYLPALPSIPLNEGKYLQFYEENHGTMQQGQHNQFFTSNLNMSPDIPVVDVASTFLLSNVQANNSHTRNFNMTGMQQQQQGRGECLGNFNMTGMHQQQQGRGESLGFRFPGAQVPNIMDPASGQIAFSNMSSLLQQPLLQIPQQANTSSVGPSSSMTQSSQHPQTYSSNYLLAAHAIHSRPSRVSNGTSKLEKNSNTQEIQAQTLTEAQSNLMPHGYYSSSLSLPPVNEGQIAHFSDREHVPLGIDEDENWLSEFHCYVRRELVELFRASQRDVDARYASKRVSYLQIGLRCRFCAHLPSGARISRSSAFPSSCSQIYQSFTMMTRDHFGQCLAVPAEIKKKLLILKGKTSQGASDSKGYWIYSARKRGMEDSREGIIVNERTIAAAQQIQPYGTVLDQASTISSNASLVTREDSTLASRFLLTLMSQANLVHLTRSEQMGNRKSLRIGLPGFGCKYCCQVGRLGLCRIFPARRRTLSAKARDLYEHLKRCSLCPSNVKELLQQLQLETQKGSETDAEKEKEFFDRVWARLGH